MTTPMDMTWPALLAHWTGIAQASLALPETAENQRWKSAIPAIVGLQAVTFALGDLDRLAVDASGAPGERALAIDKADLASRQFAKDLHTLWHDGPLPDELSLIIADARAAVRLAPAAGVEWRVSVPRLVADHPGELLTILVNSGFAGDLYLPVPGSAVFQNAPAAFARGPAGERPPELVLRAAKELLVDVTRPERVACFRQVYRQFDFGSGKVRRDLVVPTERRRASESTDDVLVPGQPQLIPAILRGKVQSVNLPIPGMSALDSVAVEFVDDTAGA
jgi:hypothetical protein